MARSRKIADGLPPRVYFRHGRHWHVLQGKWTALPVDRSEAIAMAEKLNEGVTPKWAAVLQEALERVYLSRRQNARARGLEFTITLTQIIALARAKRWRCAVTGLVFSLDKASDRRQAPLAPSIDRIDVTQGYVVGNVRVVCLATNFAMNEWGDAVMKTLAEGWLKAEFRRRVLDMSNNVQIMDKKDQ